MLSSPQASGRIVFDPARACTVRSRDAQKSNTVYLAIMRFILGDWIASLSITFPALADLLYRGGFLGEHLADAFDLGADSF